MKEEKMDENELSRKIIGDNMNEEGPR